MKATIALFVWAALATARPFPLDATFTAAQKQQQRAAADRLQADLAAALKRGAREFRVPPGVYRFSKPWPGTKYSTFRFEDVHDFLLDGQGAQFFMESLADGPVQGGFYFLRCRNLVIRNLTVDWDPVPFVQGTILSTDPDKREIVFKPDPGYEEILPALRRDKAPRIYAFDRKTRNLSALQVRLWARGIDGRGAFETPAGDGAYRLALTQPNVGKASYTPEAQGFGAGTWVAFILRPSPIAFYFDRCGRAALENVIVYSAPMGFAMGRDGDGPLEFRKCKVVRRPGTDRLLTLGADCFNAGRMTHGPVIEDGEFEAACDDFLNVFGILKPVFAQPAPNELIVARFEHNSDPAPTLHFTSLGANRLLGDRKVVSMKPEPGYAVDPGWSRLQLPRTWGDLRRAVAAGGKPVEAVRVVLDRPLPMPPEGMSFTALSAISRGTVVRNNSFRTGIARGLLLQSHDITVENNRFANILESAMVLGSEPNWWASAVNSRRVTIRGNHFEDTNLRSISQPYSGAIEIWVEGDVKATEWVEDVLIEKNTFVRPGGSAISIHGARNVRILDNEFRESGNLPWHGLGRQPEKYGLPVAVYAGEAIEQRGNRAIHTGIFALEQGGEGLLRTGK